MDDISKVQREYWGFYLEGRGESRLLKSDIDPEEIVKKLTEQDKGAFRDAVAEAARTAALPLQSGKTKRRWIAEHQEQLDALGLDAEAAFGAWLAGRADELAGAIEDSVLEALIDAVESPEDWSGDPENDEEDEEDENDEEDEDA